MTNTRHSHNDQPTHIPCDNLGTTGFVKNVTYDIKHSESPKTIAITGYWGSGKTSCLAAIFNELTGIAPNELQTGRQNQQKGSDCVGIWFEAWRYQHEASPIVALLHCIKNHFSTSSKFINSVGKLTNISVLGALTVFDGVIKTASMGASGFDKIQKMGEKYEKDNLLSRLAADQINDALTQAVETLVGKKRKKLVIFIDDLDRCEPDVAYKLLEGLKLYLNIPNCTVVMAIDQQQVERFLQRQFMTLVPEQQAEAQSQYSYLGVEYLEKLCQEAHRLPVPRQDQKEAFFVHHLEALYRDNGAPQLVAELQKVLAQFDCLPANPRRLKMLANRVAAYFRKCNYNGLAGELADANDFYREFKPIEAPKREFVLSALVLIVASLSVSYRRIYESIEISEKAGMDIYNFCKETKNEQFNSNSSVFKELNKDHHDTSINANYEHPSDLSVFKLRCLFDTNYGLHHRAGITPAMLSDMMHQLIQHYNHGENDYAL
ncbi:KAP family P-loop NTPase fold protein [Pseudoalteromonas ardens]|uniref:NTPase n=1 Tax=Pseudoalteromonas rubra TaxID=43658 RepID=A0A0L0ESB0_9GAMM|nr:P-loop NTPase fold protein [Pseudoalteromonas sp. R96]KNC67245.1 NTPase [Pseudoalteromonas rubra]MDK1311905.1 P-loop NTPase fold protein [Pseudoalteromonas sp. R96]